MNIEESTKTAFGEWSQKTDPVTNGYSLEDVWECACDKTRDMVVDRVEEILSYLLPRYGELPTREIFDKLEEMLDEE